MSDPNLTKWPWFMWFKPTKTNKAYEIGAGDDSIVCSVHDFPEGEHGSAEANAHLIAAAPELYQALNDLVNATAETYYECEIEAERVLAKARGEATDE